MKKPDEILPDVLRELEKETLIDLLIQQGKLIGELWQENEGLKKRLEELERENKRQAAPFGIEEKKRNPTKKQAGAKVGHKGYYRQVSGPIDEYVEVPLRACPHCGQVLTHMKAVGQVIEELLIRPYRLALLIKVIAQVVAEFQVVILGK